MIISNSFKKTNTPRDQQLPAPYADRTTQAALASLEENQKWSSQFLSQPFAWDGIVDLNPENATLFGKLNSSGEVDLGCEFNETDSASFASSINLPLHTTASENHELPTQAQSFLDSFSVCHQEINPLQAISDQVPVYDELSFAEQALSFSHTDLEVDYLEDPPSNALIQQTQIEERVKDEIKAAAPLPNPNLQLRNELIQPSRKEKQKIEYLENQERIHPDKSASQIFVTDSNNSSAAEQTFIEDLNQIEDTDSEIDPSNSYDAETLTRTKERCNPQELATEKKTIEDDLQFSRAFGIQAGLIDLAIEEFQNQKFLVKNFSAVFKRFQNVISKGKEVFHKAMIARMNQKKVPCQDMPEPEYLVFTEKQIECFPQEMQVSLRQTRQEQLEIKHRKNYSHRRKKRRLRD